MRLKAIATVLILLIVIAGFYGAAQSRTMMVTAQSSLSSELGKAFGGSVSLGTIDIEAFNSLSISGIELQDKKGAVLATIPEAVITFNPLKILLGNPVVETVSEITLVSPVAQVTQETDGRWNIEDLFEQQQGETPAFAGKVTVTDGMITAKTSRGAWQVNQIQGTVDFASKPAVNINLSAAYKNAKLSAAGRLANKNMDSITVKAEKLDLADLRPLVALDQNIQVLSGTLTALDVTVQRSKGAVSYAGEVKLNSFGAVVNDLAVQDGHAFITFTDKHLYILGGETKLAGQPLRLSGKVTTNTLEPVFDLAVQSAGFEPAALGQGIPVQGKIAFEARLAGTAAKPIVDGKFNLSEGSIAGYQVRNALAKLQLSDGKVTIETAKADTLGGSLSASGKVEIDSRRYNVQVKGNDIDTRALGLVPGLSGQAAFELQLDGERDLQEATINGVISLTHGDWQGIAYDSFAASIYKKGLHTTVDYITASLGQGTLTGKGAINGEQINVSLIGHNLPLALLTPAVPGAGLAVDGSSDFQGEISGSVSSPELKGFFQAKNGQILQQPFQTAAGEIAVTAKGISLLNAEMIDGPTRQQVSGSISLAGKPEVNLTLTTRQARAENIIKLLAPGETLTGNIDNTVHITGPLDNIAAEGKFTLTEGSYRGYLVAKAEGSYKRDNGVIRLEAVTIHSLNTELGVAGTIDPDGEMDLEVKAKNVDIARLHVDYPYPVSGLATLTGKVMGRSDNIFFSGELAADRLVLNGQPLETIVAKINVAGDQFEVPFFGFRQGNGRYEFSGGFNTASSTVFGSLDVEKGELQSLLGMLNVPAKGIAGSLNGRIIVNGFASKPTIWLTGNMTNGSIKGYPLENIEVDVALENQVVTVNTFTAKQGAGILAIRGSADLQGPLNLEAGGRDIDAGLLTAWFDSSIDTKGKLNFTAQVSGTAAKPHAAVSLDIKGGGVANAIFDNLYGLVILDGSSININQLMLTKGNYRASAYGLIPLAALNREGRKQATVADQMDLKLRLDQADLSILPLLTKEVSWATGQTKGEVAVTGTLAQPIVHGSLSLTDGTIKLKSLGAPIQKVGVDIQFEGDKINIKTFDGKMGAGNYRLTGSTMIRGLKLEEYNLLLVLDKLGVDHKYFQGPLSGNILLSQAGPLPKLSGTLLFENATVDIPYVPEIGAGDINAALDLEIAVGNRVRFYNPYMYDILASGKVKIGGTLQLPDASGRIEAQRGTVSYLRTQFKIKEARADFIQFRSFEPVIRLSGETKLERTQVSLNVNGPVSAMDIQLTSQPAMSQQGILSLLTLRSRYFDQQNGGRDTGLSRDEVVGLLDAGLQMRFVAEMESAFRKAFGLDEFRFVRDTLDSDNIPGKTSDRPADTDREVYNVEISKYVTDRIALNYTVGIDHKEYTAGFRYEINRRISLTGEVDERNRRRFGIETRFSF